MAESSAATAPSAPSAPSAATAMGARAAVAHADEHRQAYRDELFELLRIPSVSAQPAHDADTRRAAEWVLENVRAAGLEPELVETDGQPLVYAEWLGAPGRPTVLLYGHYDVQPPEPLDKWVSGPFEPTVRDGNVHARGATDDKGQMFTHLKAVESWLATAGALPCNVKILIEGEEEVGSAAIAKYLEGNATRLACDYVVISDCAMFARDRPSVTCGLRGIAAAEIHVTGPRRDLHSGSFGGTVMNAANALCKIVAQLTDDDGRVRLPGFYDAVVEPTAAEAEQSAALPFDEDAYRREVGSPELFGEAGYTTLQRKSVRPTCDVNGLTSGYQGEGSKTVIPSVASAKVTFRLVPDQQPGQVADALRAFVEQVKPPGVTVEVVGQHGAAPVVVSPESPGMEAAAVALEAAFGKPPLYTREGGSIPIVSEFKKHLGADSLLVGYGLADDNTHSPNEKFRLEDFHRGIAANIHLLAAMAERVPG